ncbi:MAG: type II and III secretion system protein family protein [Pseudomonadota bacterium]|nr:type II and III secretion system protein family protein [Pseudomonadota bacterium]
MRSMSAATALALSLAVAASGLAFTTVPTRAADSGDYLRLSSSSIGSTRRVKVGLNKSLVVDLPGDAHDILVANPDVADAVTRTSRRIYIFAKQVGETNIFIFDAAGRQLLSVDLVIERDIKGLETYIEKYVPGSEVTVEMVNDNVILTGTVPTPQASARAVQLAQIFVSGGEATTNNFGGNSNVQGGSGTTIVFGDDEERQESQIVNLLQIDGEDQVHLKVTIAEIQRTVVKQLGIDMTALGSIGDVAFNLLTDNPFLLNKNFSSSQLNANWSHGGNSINAIMHALDSAGVMRTLAEPTLTAISGETASFKVGGEYQVTDGKDEDEDGVTYSYKEVSYGVGLAFTPVVLSPGRISLKLRTEVSEPTSEGSYAIPRGGVPAAPIPGIRRREAETTVELPSGGSMVIAGLLKDDVRQTAQGFPGLRRIPVLGALFRSREFERYETELVVIVTPYLVRPTARQNLARPDDNFHPASDAASIFLGQVNRIYGVAQGTPPAGRYHGNPGFIYK